MKYPLQKQGVIRTKSNSAAIASHRYTAPGVTPSNAWCEEECRDERSNMSEREFHVCLAQCRLN